MGRKPTKNKSEDVKIADKSAVILERNSDRYISALDADYDPASEVAMIKEVEANLASEDLSLREVAFVNNLCIHWDPVEAAIQAGFSILSARRISSALMKSTKIKKEIRRKQNNLNAKMNNLYEAVTQEYAKLAFYNAQDFLDEEGNAIPLHEMDRNLSAVIKEIEIESKFNDSGNETKVTKMKMADKKAALDSLGKNIGFFTADKDVFVEYGLKNVLALLPEEIQDQIKLSIRKKIEQKQIGN